MDRSEIEAFLKVDNGIKSVVGNVAISTCYTPDRGWETMAFEIKGDGVRQWIVWSDIYEAHHYDETDAYSHHREIVSRMESDGFRILDDTNEDGYSYGRYLVI